MKRVVCLLIRGYQVIGGPLLGGSCRFFPSCSEFTRQAVDRFGVWKGLRMGALRILKCNPFCEGGYDPCPPKSV